MMGYFDSTRTLAPRRVTCADTEGRTCNSFAIESQRYYKYNCFHHRWIEHHLISIDFGVLVFGLGVSVRNVETKYKYMPNSSK
jgi:hypothetical protein